MLLLTVKWERERGLIEGGPAFKLWVSGWACGPNSVYV